MSGFRRLAKIETQTSGPGRFRVLLHDVFPSPPQCREPLLPPVSHGPFCLGWQILVAQKVCQGVYKGVTTSELDELAAETAASMTATHPDYALVRPAHTLCNAELSSARGVRLQLV